MISKAVHFSSHRGICKIYKLKLLLQILAFSCKQRRICPGIEWVQKIADISRLALTVCCHNNETCAPIANLPNSAQLDSTPYHTPSYIWVRAVVWECSEGQTDNCDQYTFHLGCAPCET